jgi:hypothetical protein
MGASNNVKRGATQSLLSNRCGAAATVLQCDDGARQIGYHASLVGLEYAARTVTPVIRWRITLSPAAHPRQGSRSMQTARKRNIERCEASSPVPSVLMHKPAFYLFIARNKRCCAPPPVRAATFPIVHHGSCVSPRPTSSSRQPHRRSNCGSERRSSGCRVPVPRR